MGNTLQNDRYAIRLDATQRAIIATQIVVSILWIGFVCVFLDGPTAPVAAVVKVFGVPVLVYLGMLPITIVHERSIRRSARDARFRICPTCHYPTRAEGMNSLRCTECGFLGDARMVESAWAQWCGVR